MVYEPKDGDANYRDPTFDPKAKPDFTKRRELFAGQPTFKSISMADSRDLVRIYARAFAEFDAAMTAKLSVKDEASLSRTYGGCELFGSVRVARTMLAAASIGLFPESDSLAEEARVFLKYSANTMTGYFTIRYIDQGVAFGTRQGTLSHSMTANAQQMFSLGDRDGFKYVTHWLSLSSGYMEVRDGMGMRVGGPVAKSVLPDHLADLLQTRMDSLAVPSAAPTPVAPLSTHGSTLAAARAAWEVSPLKSFTPWDLVEAAVLDPSTASGPALVVQRFPRLRPCQVLRL